MKRLSTIVVVLALVVLPLMRPGFTARVSAAQANYCLDANASAFLQLINDYRQANGLPAYTASPTLGAAALAHSQDMATQDYSSHTGKDGSTPQDRMNAAGYPVAQANFSGENIYWGGGADLGTPQAAFDWWRNSPGHNANMLSPNFTAIGIGVATNPATGKTHWTTTFGGFVDATASPCADAGAGNGAGNGAGTGNGNGAGNGQGNGAGNGTGNGQEGGNTNPATDTGMLTVTIHQCPPEANPEAGDFTHCLDIEDPDGLLIDTATNQSVTLSTAPERPELTHNYRWPQLAVGTYQIEPKLAGKQWTLVNIGIANPQAHQDTFEVRKGEETFVELFVYGSDATTGNTNGNTTTGGTTSTCQDTDADGVSDSDEQLTGSDPNNPDTDGDGVTDGQEWTNGTNPLDPANQPITIATVPVSSPCPARQDTDNDGLYDDDETDVYGTDPMKADTDGDGVDDGQEVFDGTNPLDPASSNGANTGSMMASPVTGSENTSGGGQAQTAPIAVMVYQCPADADPAQRKVEGCAVVADPKGELIDTGTNQPQTLDSAPRIDDPNHVYYWDELPLGTYRVDPKLPGKTWTMVQPDGMTAPTHAENDTFEVKASTELLLVQVYVYGSDTGATGGLTVAINQCPADRAPEQHDISNCPPIDAPAGKLVNVTTNEEIMLSSAPDRPAGSKEYAWDAIPAGTYRVDPQMPDAMWLLSVGKDLKANVYSASTSQDSSQTFEVKAGETVRVDLFLYGSAVMTPTPTAASESATTDSDNDGLYDSDETDVYLSDPHKADTDGDGVDDGQEVVDGTNPNDPNSHAGDSARKDTDGDGLYDDDETNVYATDPNNPDTDGDGVDDGQEVFDGTNPTDPGSHL